MNELTAVLIISILSGFLLLAVLVFIVALCQCVRSKKKYEMLRRELQTKVKSHLLNYGVPR